MVNDISASKQLAALDPDRIPLPNKATGIQNQKNMKITAVALITIGAVGTILSAASIVAGAMGMSLGALPAGGLIGVGIWGMTASISAIAAGIFLLKCPYWKDQSYVDQQSLHAMNMSFADVVDTFGWERISEQHLISNKALKQKFFEKIDRLDYKTVIDTHGQEIRQQKFISFKELTPKLMAEAKDMTAQAFKEKYSNQPIIDGVVDANDALYSNMMKNGIKDLPYYSIARDFAAERASKVLKNEYIAEVLRAQIEGKSFYTFFKEQGSAHTWDILKDGILPLQFFKDHLTKEIGQERLPLIQILERYGWDAFNHNILEGPKLREQFLQQVKNLLFSDIIQRYGWNVLDKQVATCEDLRPHAVRECQSIPSFAQILERLGTNVFEKRILTAKDAVIIERVKSLYEKMQFCTMIDAFGDVLVKYGLLPENPAITSLLQDKRVSDQTLTQKKWDAEQSYRQSESQAARARDGAIASSEQVWRAASEAVERERTNYKNNQTRIEGQKREETLNHERTLKRMQRENPLGSFEAEISRHRVQLKSLEMALEQENDRYRLQLRILNDHESNLSRAHQYTKNEQNNSYDRIVREAKKARDERVEMASKLHKTDREAIDGKFKALKL